MLSNGKLTMPKSSSISVSSNKIEVALQASYNLGIQHAQNLLKIQQESMKSVVKGMAKHAAHIITTFLSTVKDWFSRHKDSTGLQGEYEERIDNLSDVTAQYEVVAMMEQGVLDTLEESGVSEVICVNSPGACEVCVANAEQGSIKLGETFVSGHSKPPFHGYCRCHLSMVEKE